MKAIYVLLIILFGVFFANSQNITKIIVLLNDTSVNNGCNSIFQTIETFVGHDTLVSFGSFNEENKHGLWLYISKEGSLKSYEMYFKGILLESCKIDSNGYFWDVEISNSDIVSQKLSSEEDSIELLPYLNGVGFVGLLNGLHLYKKGNYVEIVEEYEDCSMEKVLTKNGIFLLFRNGRLYMTTRLKENKINGDFCEYGDSGIKKKFTYKDGVLDGKGFVYYKKKVIGCFEYWDGILYCCSKVNNKTRKEGFMVNKIFVPFYDYSIIAETGQSEYNGIYGLNKPGEYKPSRCKCNNAN